jgi:hypothetical protein
MQGPRRLGRDVVTRHGFRLKVDDVLVLDEPPRACPLGGSICVPGGESRSGGNWTTRTDNAQGWQGLYTALLEGQEIANPAGQRLLMNDACQCHEQAVRSAAVADRERG